MKLTTDRSNGYTRVIAELPDLDFELNPKARLILQQMIMECLKNIIMLHYDDLESLVVNAMQSDEVKAKIRETIIKKAEANIQEMFKS